MATSLLSHNHICFHYSFLTHGTHKGRTIRVASVCINWIMECFVLTIAFSVFRVRPALSFQKYDHSGSWENTHRYAHMHIHTHTHIDTMHIHTYTRACMQTHIHRHTRSAVRICSPAVSGRKLFSEPISKIIGVCFCGWLFAIQQAFQCLSKMTLCTMRF